MQIKFLIIIICILLFAGGVGYKIQERAYLNNLVNTFQENFAKDLALVEEHSNLEEVAYQHMMSWSDSSEKDSLLDSQNKVSKIVVSTKIVKNHEEEYRKKIEADQKRFQELKSQGFFLIGDTRDFADEFLGSINLYYENEIKLARNEEIGIDYTVNLFETLKDYFAALDHSNSIAKVAKSKISDHFYKISSLEKYTRPDFSFKNEEGIKILLPYEYEVLDKYKEYLSSYYSVSKDISNGNYDSASYKASKLSSDASNLTVDWDRIGKSDDSEQTDRGKIILEEHINQIKLIQDFNQRNLGRYPIGNKIEFTNKDLMLCHAYYYKTGLFSLITSEDPKSKTAEGLIKELSTISPKTDDLDVGFDKEVMKYISDDKKGELICQDKIANKSYKFTDSK